MTQRIADPTAGTRIEVAADGSLNVPHDPIITYIEGDGIGPDIWAAAVRVFDAAVDTAYSGDRTIVWHEVFAGEKAHAKFGEWLRQSPIRL